ncbi:MAG: hypothetical protein HYZ79_06040 [Candidatus Melainabacteria bacterium]|nr:hypothetical protein [Candidatus Melainabacteria bacterium]
MSVGPVQSVGARLLDVGKTVVRSPFEIVGGSFEGYSAYRAGATNFVGSTATGGTIAETVGTFLKNIFGKLFTSGLTGINATTAEVGGVTLGQAFKNIFTAGSGNFGTAITAFGGRFAAAGAAGGTLALGHVGLAAIGIIMGAQLALKAYSKFSDTKKGYHPDTVSNPYIHLAQAFTGLTTAIGGAMMFVNPALGLATLGVGFAGSLGIGVLKHFMGGFNWFRYPDLAPYPLNKLFGTHRNPGVYDGQT